jgi:dienelactone hydrolase
MHNGSVHNKATALLLLSALLIVTGCSSTITTTQTLTNTLATTLTSTIPPVTTTFTSTTTAISTQTTTATTSLPPSTVTITPPPSTVTTTRPPITKTITETITADASNIAGLPNGYLLEKRLYLETIKFKVYEITYISDGLRVKGYLSLPLTPGPHPAIIWCRGGHKNYGLAEYYQISNYTYWLGYVAVGSQYRGNMGGDGQDQFGGGDVNDVVNLIPLLKSLPEVDPDHIGLVGASRGGMMAYMTLRKQTLAGTNDIKVAVIVSGSADLFFAAQKQPDMLNGVFIPLIGGTPQQLPKEYEARSAVYWANDINVPILLQHGDQDVHVYIDEANKMAAELQKYGKTYKYIVYPGRGHDLIMSGQNWTDQLAWIKSYLQ